MSTRRKALLAILAVTFLVDVGIFWKRSHKNQDQGNGNMDIIEKLSKEIEDFNKELSRMTVEADIIIGPLQHLPPPTNRIRASFHDGGNEEAWIQDVDPKTGLVLVTTTDSKINITFKPGAGDLQKFNIGWIAPITVLCPDNSNDCDFDSLKKLYIRNKEVKLLEREFLGEARKLKIKREVQNEPK